MVWVRGGGSRRPRGIPKIGEFSDGKVMLFKNPGALRRFFLPPDVRVVPAAEVIQAVTEMDDPRTVVLAAEEVGTWRPPPREWAPRVVRIENMVPGRIELRVPPAGEKLLATSLPIPEGWRAFRGDEELETVTVNSAYLGVVVPEKIKRVRLEFTPPGLRAGGVVFLVSLLGVAFSALFFRRRAVGGVS